MKPFLASSVVLFLSIAFVDGAAATEATAVPPARTAATDAESNAVVEDVCVLCHNETTLLGNLSLEDFDVTAADEHADIAEKMIRKLRAGMMPPPGIPRPDEATMQALVETLEAVVDAAATRDPNPGIRSFQRLNRAEYERAIAELLSLDVDAGSWLPLDQMSSNFDNIADAQTLSPTLLEAYLNAAGDISRMAIGDRSAPSLDKTYINPIYLSQHPWNHVEGTPYGTRGGMAVEHVFPADAEYVFEMTFGGGENSSLEDIDVSIDGERVALLHYTQTEGGADGRGGDPIGTEPIVVGAGQHQVAAAFIKRTDGPYEDLIRPHDWSFAGGGSGGLGITTLPHLQSLVVRGPLNTTGLSDTPSRKRVFTCRPTTPEEERPCAESILGRLASEAYRRPVTPGDLEGLMEFYDTGVAKGGFEIGVRTALEAILASPYFVLRLEREPKHVRPGQEFRVTDIDSCVATLVFSLGNASGRGPPRARERRHARKARRARTANEAHACRPSRRSSRHEVRGSVASAPGSLQGSSRPELLSELRREPRQRHAAGDGALLLRRRQRRPERAPSVRRRLHLRQRASRSTLWDSRRCRQRVPTGEIP